MSKSVSPPIVVVTAKNDAHLPYVQRHLGTPLFVIDPLALAEGTELTYGLNGSELVVSSDNVVLDGVQSVWYRKPTDVKAKQLPVSEGLVGYSLHSIHAHARQLLTAFKKAQWVSDYSALYRASNKTLQLQAAAEVGFRVPRTLVTSDPHKAEAFIESYEEGCIVKPYAAYATSSKELPKSFLTTKVSRHNLPELKNLYLAPAIFQQAIHSVCDIRVTVVGDKCFAARVRNEGQDPGSLVRDWRVGYYQGTLHIEPYDNFPKEVAQLCVLHAKRLGLLFSAIDLVEDNKGQIWFLENNPNGQWAFIEEEAGQPIGKAIAELLMSASKRRDGL